MSKELKRNIERLGLQRRAKDSKRGVLDVLVLSHYDADHLNGAQYLSKKAAVRRVFVPYLRPDELALVIASQAGAISPSAVMQLHGLAHGNGTLWGIPVIMVQGGETPDRDAGDSDERPTPQDPDEGREELPNTIDELPNSVRIGVSKSGSGLAPLSEVISDTDNVLIELTSRKRLWKLRFWNREPSDELLAKIRSNLKNCGFPLDKLDDPLGAEEVGDWVDLQKNRKKAVRAYHDAIKECGPSWAREASDGLENLLSLAMYSGPDFDIAEIRYKRIHESMPRCCGWEFFLESSTVGWLGTGDAPLGEAAVWSDFSTHYSSEIPQTSTYLVPHHGAAPPNGPTFYNSNLNHTGGVASVISYGTTNHYGHPAFSVRGKILSKRGEVYCVTEKHEDGLQELIQLRGR